MKRTYYITEQFIFVAETQFDETGNVVFKADVYVNAQYHGKSSNLIGVKIKDIVDVSS